MKIPFLIGYRIYLRGLEEKDIDGNYIKWLNDPEVCKFNSHHFFPYDKGNAIEYIKNINSSQNNLILAIILKKGDIHIGNIALQQINRIYQSAEFAILLGEKKYWNKGYAKEAAKLVLNHGFLQLNLERIYCGTLASNLPMRKLAKFLGMKEEGIRRNAIFKNGKYHDVVEYGILHKEYSTSS